jgi:hypothetical protein
MSQTILLPAEDVAALRVALSFPEFAPLRVAAPSLTLALAHPQPDFTPWLDWVSDAISEVRSNTNHPEDWNPLEDAVSDLRKASRALEDAVPEQAPAATLTAFVLVAERMGSNDGARFGQHVYLNYDAACAALRAWVQADFGNELDDDSTLDEYGAREHSAFGINLMYGESVSSQYYLKSFIPAQATVSAGEAA